MTRALLLALALLGLAGCGNSQPTATPIVSATTTPPSQLRRSGRFLVDEKSRVVLLHGVNAVWKLPPYAPPDTAEGFTAADADWLRDHGFNSVRLGVLFEGVMPQECVVDPGYLAGMDRVVQLLASRGL